MHSEQLIIFTLLVILSMTRMENLLRKIFTMQGPTLRVKTCSISYLLCLSPCFLIHFKVYQYFKCMVYRFKESAECRGISRDFAECPERQSDKVFYLDSFHLLSHHSQGQHRLRNSGHITACNTHTTTHLQAGAVIKFKNIMLIIL